MLLGAMTLPLALAACGVKGPLEPPAGARLADQPQSSATDPLRPTGTSPTVAQSSIPTGTSPGVQAGPGSPLGTGTTSPAVRQAPAARERSVLDWLIN
jgi:predicted small lipoprotein YifL